MHAFLCCLYACHDLPYDRGAKAAVTKTKVRTASGVASCRVKEEVKVAHLQGFLRRSKVDSLFNTDPYLAYQWRSVDPCACV